MENREGNFQFVDINSPEIMEKLDRAPVYKKNVRVKARRAMPGEEIRTILKDGSEETVNVAREGDWVVTNPDEESYVVSGEKFFARYEATGNKGVYAAKGYCRAIPNPFKKPIEIMAPWGSPQRGDENCFIADTCDPDGNREGKPYIIDGHAFRETYRKVER